MRSLNSRNYRQFLTLRGSVRLKWDVDKRKASVFDTVSHIFFIRRCLSINTCKHATVDTIHVFLQMRTTHEICVNIRSFDELNHNTKTLIPDSPAKIGILM